MPGERKSTRHFLSTEASLRRRFTAYNSIAIMVTRDGVEGGIDTGPGILTREFGVLITGGQHNKQVKVLERS